MQIIIDPDDSGNRLILLKRQHGWLIVAVLTLLLIIGIGGSAYGLARYWLKNHQPMTRYSPHQEQPSWLESAKINGLRDEINTLNTRLDLLNRRATVIADHLGLGDNHLFVANEEYEDTGTDVWLIDDTASGLSAALSWQSATLAHLNAKYRLLSERGMQRLILNETTPILRPVNDYNWITSGYGYRRDPFTGRSAFHSGIDYSARRGTPVFAGATGLITTSGRYGNYGNTVEIYHGDGVSTLYGHLQDILVSPWQYVNRNDVIGTVGSTGRSTGPHLHYEIRLNNRPQSPSKVLKQINKKRQLESEQPT